MSARLLYSVNPLMKLLLQDAYFGGLHHVWCAEQWDHATLPAYSAAARVPASSDPRELYRGLQKAVSTGDRHCEVIQRVTDGYVARGLADVAAGKLSQLVYDEIVVQLKEADLQDWRPMVYIIHRDMVAPRLLAVKPAKRAGMGPEYVIPDLARHEFELLEF